MIKSFTKIVRQPMNNFFSNRVTNLNVPEYHDCDDIFGNTSDPILKVLVKYKNHFIIKALNPLMPGGDVKVTYT